MMSFSSLPARKKDIIVVVTGRRVYAQHRSASRLGQCSGNPFSPLRVCPLTYMCIIYLYCSRPNEFFWKAYISSCIAIFLVPRIRRRGCFPPPINPTTPVVHICIYLHARLYPAPVNPPSESVHLSNCANLHIIVNALYSCYTWTKKQKQNAYSSRVRRIRTVSVIYSCSLPDFNCLRNKQGRGKLFATCLRRTVIALL